MTPEIDKQFSNIKEKYGSHSIERIEEMLHPKKLKRHPLQADAKFIVPELSTTPWLETSDFIDLLPLVNRLETDSGKIKNEINKALDGNCTQLSKYQHYLGENDKWNALYLFKDNKKIEAAKSVVPTTWDILENELSDWYCPLLEVHFSILLPGASIQPHCDLWNFTINLHLAVDIPSDCKIIVADEPRNWEEGRCLLFDYSFQHYAYNRNPSGHRICLLMDIWHPSLSHAEKEALIIVITEIRHLMGDF